MCGGGGGGVRERENGDYDGRDGNEGQEDSENGSEISSTTSLLLARRLWYRRSLLLRIHDGCLSLSLPPPLALWNFDFSSFDRIYIPVQY